MAATPALAAAERAGVTVQVHSYRHDPAASDFGAEAVRALGVPSERVFKTLVLRLDDGLVVAVVPVSGRLNLRALAAAGGGKRAVLAEPREAERTTGYPIGGISPIGQRHRLPTIVDASAQTQPTVFVSGGRRGLEIELSPDALVLLTGARYAAITR